MRETPAGFRRRTGEPYDPPVWLRALGRPLADGEPCPTLFRYPGPCGLTEFFEGRLRLLGSPARPEIWMAEAPRNREAPNAVQLGTLAVLQPLRLAPCLTAGSGIWVGVNGDLDASEAAFWVPPSALDDPIDWDGVASPAQARSLFGPGWETELEGVRALLARWSERAV